MQDYELAWMIRYIVLGLAECCSLLVILTVVVGRLYKYTSCLIIFLMQIAYAIVNINALLYTDRFTVNRSPLINSENVFTKEQPWNALCQIQAYIIHTSWMTSFFLSLLLITFEYWILSNKLFRRVKLKVKLLWACLLVPMVIQIAPFLYMDSGYGYGPNGFNVPAQAKNTWESVYFFCGWSTSMIYPRQQGFSRRQKQQLAYGFNYMFPLFCGLVYEVYIMWRIRRVKKIFEEEGIKISKQQQYITQLHKVPFYLFVILLVNMVIRLIPNVSLEFPQPIKYIILVWDFAYDVIPILSSYQFFSFIRSSISIPRLQFLSRKPAHDQSLLTENTERPQESSQSMVSSI